MSRVWRRCPTVGRLANVMWAADVWHSIKKTLVYRGAARDPPPGDAALGDVRKFRIRGCNGVAPAPAGVRDTGPRCGGARARQRSRTCDHGSDDSASGPDEALIEVHTRFQAMPKTFQ